MMVVDNADTLARIDQMPGERAAGQTLAEYEGIEVSWVRHAGIVACRLRVSDADYPISIKLPQATEPPIKAPTTTSLG